LRARRRRLSRLVFVFIWGKGPIHWFKADTHICNSTCTSKLNPDLHHIINIEVRIDVLDFYIHYSIRSSWLHINRCIVSVRPHQKNGGVLQNVKESEMNECTWVQKVKHNFTASRIRTRLNLVNCLRNQHIAKAFTVCHRVAGIGSNG
jgi:hypothetical protein